MTRKRKNYIKYGEITKAIFSYIVESLFGGYETAMRRTRSYFFDELIEVGEIFLKGLTTPSEKRKRVASVLRRLEHQEIINLKLEGDKVFVSLKDKNKPKVKKYLIKSLLDLKLKKKRWQGNWVVVFFDVPEEQRNKRDYLRRFLKEIGFFPYQKSVYVFPYECKKEIDLIKKIIAGGKYLKYVIATQIEDEEKIKTYFKLNRDI